MKNIVGYHLGLISGLTSLIITAVQIPEEDLAVCAGRDEQAVRGAPGADVDVGRLLVAGEPLT